MPVNLTGPTDLAELSHLLRKERLFIGAEHESVEQLTAHVAMLTASVTQHAWIAAQQRLNLHQLVLARQDSLPALQAQRGYAIDKLRFLDAGPVLGYSESAAYSAFLAALRDSPELLAGCLTSGDRNHPERVPGVINTLSAGLFGSCLLSSDKRTVLRLLRHLAQLQLAPSDNPRRLLRHGTCSFSRLYSAFHENLHSAQLFLTAALHGPIMTLLAEDMEFLDVDPEKAAVWGSPEPSVQRRQGHATVMQLVALTQLFITSIEDNLFCFPPSVSWLLRQLVSMLNEAGCLPEKEVYELCTDLLLTHFICPAIVNPEPHGIIEAPVSRVGRFNLMQVAKILQTLAMSKYEECDSKVKDLYLSFNPDCVPRIISNILDGGTDFIELPPEGDADLEGVTRAAALLSASQLNALVCFLQTILNNNDEFVDRKNLETLLAGLPANLVNGHKDSGKSRTADSATKKSGLLAKGLTRSRSHVNGEGVDDAATCDDVSKEAVLVFRLTGELDEELLTEAKVMAMEGKLEVLPARCVVDGPDLPDSSETSHSQEKRTRFSLSHDEGSIGNTSDNLEAISEAASNHSGASSLESENEDQNDNLSDMVSANVSGRGSPNISGRDTPSSQITEGEAVERVAPAPRPVSKQSRSDIEDKFCKFEIKKQELVGDETVSMVSDTWSTDVLASDSETAGEVDRFSRPLDEGPPHPFIQHSLDISETASEAWSTDVMASDSERLTEVDTDDTASVAPSDDTAASEPGGRGDAGDEPDTPPPVTFRPAAPGDGRGMLHMLGRGEEPDTPPPAVFRPIARFARSDDTEAPRLSLTVPPSPTRGSDAHSNVTGRGGAKADYKRRTLEFVGAVTKPSSLASLESPRMMHVIDRMDGSGKLGPGRGGVRLMGPPPPSVPTALQMLCEETPRAGAGAAAAQEDDSSAVQLCEEAGRAASTMTQLEIRMSSVSFSCSSLTIPPPNHAQDMNLIAFDDVTPPASLVNAFKSTPTDLVATAKLADAKRKQEPEEGDRVFRSSTSLASSSSSGSNAAFGGVGAVAAGASAPAHTNETKLTPTAIPKSISFDKTADKDFLDDKKQKRGFFGNLKMSFKNRKMKKGDGSEGESSGDRLPRVRRVMSEDYRMHNGGSIEVEDILAKYRGKRGEEREERDGRSKRSAGGSDAGSAVEQLRGLSEEAVFLNAKRKLRIVFSRAVLQSWPPASAMGEKALVSFLQLQLAEARSVQNRDLVSQLHEALRCVQLFDAEGCRRLVAALRNDLVARASYAAYLTQVRQMLLSRTSQLSRVMARICLGTRLTEAFLIALCVRLFLERREDSCRHFTLQFRHLSVADEKTDLLDAFLAEMSAEMDRDPAWQGTTEEQRDEAEAAVRTLVLCRVYPYAFYPNGDGDISRDQVLHNHIKKLADIITPNHKDLQIPLRYHGECPWPSAQAELSALASYKTPQDKVTCVHRCAATIMNLLALASEGSVPAADEFLPVLVYVIIAANPVGLLSTVQYIDSFYRNLSGAELYYWTQFCSAIELIKTMDYTV